MIRTRTMTAGDLPAAASVGAEAGWPGWERRFEFHVRHPHCEAVAAEVGGEVAGVGFGTRNGTVGWIGLVCVRPRYRGRRIGRSLKELVAERLTDLGCRTLVLTATGIGRPLYEKMGFETETFYHGLSGPGLNPEPRPPGIRRMRPADLAQVCGLDLRMTGEDRSHLLRALGGTGWAVGDGGGIRGYHLPVPWGGGPILAEDPGDGLALACLARSLACPDATVRFWLASENKRRKHLEDTGFGEVGRLPRMVRGEPLSWRPGALWGLFSLGKG